MILSPRLLFVVSFTLLSSHRFPCRPRHRIVLTLLVPRRYMRASRTRSCCPPSMRRPLATLVREIAFTVALTTQGTLRWHIILGIPWALISIAQFTSLIRSTSLDDLIIENSPLSERRQRHRCAPLARPRIFPYDHWVAPWMVRSLIIKSSLLASPARCSTFSSLRAVYVLTAALASKSVVFAVHTPLFGVHALISALAYSPSYSCPPAHSPSART